MRPILSCLLILTLVLRGLLGDAMAMGIVAPAMPAHTSATAEAHQHSHAASPHEHAMAMDTAMQHGAEHDTASAHAMPSHCAPADTAHCGDSAAHGAACSACGICHSAVGLVGLAALPALDLTAQHGAAIASQFASALPALVAKPPISAL